jgi:hypothetical protein
LFWLFLSTRLIRNHMDFTWFFFGSCGWVSHLSFLLPIVSKLLTMQCFFYHHRQDLQFRNIHDWPKTRSKVCLWNNCNTEDQQTWKRCCKCLKKLALAVTLHECPCHHLHSGPKPCSGSKIHRPCGQQQK